MRRARANLDLLSGLRESAHSDVPDDEAAVAKSSHPGGQTLTVSELAALVKDVLADAMPGPIRVVGEVSNFSDRTHWFFSLKDEEAQIRCVCFASRARTIRFGLEDGMQVVATGRVDYYDARGDLQLYVDRLEPVGQGALELRFRALCEQLRQLGYFAEEQKKQLPLVPRTVAVLTSRTGAALQDVINTASKRWAGCRLLLFDVHVQGEAAAPEIAQAINALSCDGPSIGIDAVILTRGGGSIEDLWAFNERIVADAVFNSSIPIVAAIGHETDTTIAELVADTRCATPTQAAMALIPDKNTLMQQVDQLTHRLGFVLVRGLERRREQLEFVARHPLFRRPQASLAPHKIRVDRITEQLGHAVRDRVASARRVLVEHQQSLGVIEPRARIRLARQQLGHQRHRLGALIQRARDLAQARLSALGQQLQAINPKNVLARGFSYTIGPDGHMLRSSKVVKIGDPMTTVLSDGRILSRVEDSDAELPKSPAPKAQKPSRSSKRRENEQGSLFDAE